MLVKAMPFSWRCVHVCSLLFLHISPTDAVDELIPKLEYLLFNILIIMNSWCLFWSRAQLTGACWFQGQELCVRLFSSRGCPGGRVCGNQGPDLIMQFTHTHMQELPRACLPPPWWSLVGLKFIVVWLQSTEWSTRRLVEHTTHYPSFGCRGLGLFCVLQVLLALS